MLKLHPVPAMLRMDHHPPDLSSSYAVAATVSVFPTIDVIPVTGPAGILNGAGLPVK